MNLSVVITYFNKRDLLIKAFDSVASQIEDNDEIIIVNDFSSEKSSRIFYEKFKKVNPELVYIDHHKNLGASEAKNNGIRKATNEIIVLLDADDTLPPEAINKIKRGFQQCPKADLIYGNYMIIGTTNTLVSCNKITRDNNKIDKKALTKEWILLGTSPFKKSLFNEIGGFDKFNPRTDDRDFHVKALLNGFNFFYLDYTIYNWHQETGFNNSFQIPAKDVLSSYFRNIMFNFNYATKLRFLLVLIKNTFKISYARIINR